MTYIFYLKNQLWWTHVQHIVYTCITEDTYVTLLKVYTFSEQQDQTAMKMMAQVIQHLRVPKLQFPQSSASRTVSRLLDEMV